MNGALFCIALFGGGLVAGVLYAADHWLPTAWRRKIGHVIERGAAVLAAGVAFALMVSLAGVFPSVWADAARGIGLLVQGAALIGLGALALATIVGGWQHHRHSTIALGAGFGIVVALVFGDWKVSGANLGKAFGSAGSSITSAGHGTTGTASHAHAHAAASGGVWGVILLLIVVAVIMVIVVRKHRKGEVANVGRAAALEAGGRGGSSPRPIGPTGRTAFAGGEN